MLSLPIFPEGSLASSVITTVWVGIFVITFFNLRFGWGMSGLVVPGYLVPLLLLKPWAVLAITVEGITAYLAVVAFMRAIEASGYISELFGRDRFFVIVIASVITRLGFDSWLFPIIGSLLVEHGGITFDYSDNLHSFGLIIVALIANHLWKPGLRTGLFWYAVTLGLTALIVRFILMEFTNFSLSNISYLYEDVASSILASPKAYIILLTTGFIASRLNLLYGWEYSGILIPSLLALQWYQPGKILFTAIETLIIVLLAGLALRLPFFKDRDISGSRQLLLFFNVSFIYKFVLGFALLIFAPEVKVSDYFGFGYLLSTLLAVKMFNKDIVAQSGYATIHVSFVGIALATLIGFSFTLLKPVSNDVVAEFGSQEFEHISLDAMFASISEHNIRRYGNLHPQPKYHASFQDNDAFRAGLKLIQEYSSTADGRYLSTAASQFESINYSLRSVTDRYVLLSDNSSEFDRGLFLLALNAPSGLLIEAPATVSNLDSADAATSLFFKIRAHALSLTEDIRHRELDSIDTFQSVFHETMNTGEVLRIRSYSESTIPLLTPTLVKHNIDPLRPPNTLWVHRSIPNSFSLTELTRMLGDYRTIWAVPPQQRNLQLVTNRGVSVLYLDDQSAAFLSPELEDRSADAPAQVNYTQGYLSEWLLTAKELLAESGSELYHAPSFAELAYLDREVVTPLLTLRGQLSPNSPPNPEQDLLLSRIAERARRVNLALTVFNNRADHSRYLILADDPLSAQRNHWGIYALRLGPRKHINVSIPHPLFEAQTYEMGAIILKALQADSLFIAGSHPRANLDGSANVIQSQNKDTAFNLLHTALLRQLYSQSFLSIQIRGFAFREKPPPSADHFLLAFSGGDTGAYVKSENPMRSLLTDTFTDLGFRFQVESGNYNSSGFENPMTPQFKYIDATPNKMMATLWLTPYSRAAYRDRRDDSYLHGIFSALNIPIAEADLRTLLKSTPVSPFPPELENTVINSLRQYISTRNVMALIAIIELGDQVQVRLLIDRASGLAFLALFDHSDKLSLVANLFPISDKIFRFDQGQLDDELIDDFLTSGTALLRLESSL